MGTMWLSSLNAACTIQTLYLMQQNRQRQMKRISNQNHRRRRQPGGVVPFQCLGRKRFFELEQEWKLNARSLQNLYLMMTHLMMTRLIVMLHNLKLWRVGGCKLHTGRILLSSRNMEYYLQPKTGQTIPYQEDLTLNLRITIFSPPLLATNSQMTCVNWGQL